MPINDLNQNIFGEIEDDVDAPPSKSEPPIRDGEERNPFLPKEGSLTPQEEIKPKRRKLEPPFRIRTEEIPVLGQVEKVAKGAVAGTLGSVSSTVRGAKALSNAVLRTDFDENDGWFASTEETLKRLGVGDSTLARYSATGGEFFGFGGIIGKTAKGLGIAATGLGKLVTPKVFNTAAKAFSYLSEAPGVVRSALDGAAFNAIQDFDFIPPAWKIPIYLATSTGVGTLANRAAGSARLLKNLDGLAKKNYEKVFSSAKIASPKWFEGEDAGRLASGLVESAQKIADLSLKIKGDAGRDLVGKFSKLAAMPKTLRKSRALYVNPKRMIEAIKGINQFIYDNKGQFGSSFGELKQIIKQSKEGIVDAVIRDKDLLKLYKHADIATTAKHDLVSTSKNIAQKLTSLSDKTTNRYLIYPMLFHYMPLKSLATVGGLETFVRSAKSGLKNFPGTLGNYGKHLANTNFRELYNTYPKFREAIMGTMIKAGTGAGRNQIQKELDKAASIARKAGKSITLGDVPEFGEIEDDK